MANCIQPPDDPAHCSDGDSRDEETLISATCVSYSGDEKSKWISDYRQRRCKSNNSLPTPRKFLVQAVVHQNAAEIGRVQIIMIIQ